MATQATANVDQIEMKLDEDVEGVQEEVDQVDVAAPVANELEEGKDMASESHTGSGSGSGSETEPDPLSNQPKTETTEDSGVLCSTETVAQVNGEPLLSEPGKDSAEKLQVVKVPTEESSGGPSDEPSDASDSNPPRQQAKELEQEEKSHPVANGLEEDEPSEQETVTEELEGKAEDTENGAAPEATKKQVEETESLKAEGGSSTTEDVEIVSMKEREAHASVIDQSPPGQAEKIEVEEDAKKEDANAAKQVEIEALNKEEPKEPSAVEALSREVAEREHSTQEAHQAGADAGCGEEAVPEEAIKVEEAIEEGNVKTEDEMPEAGNGDLQVQVVSKSEPVTEAVKDDDLPEAKTDVVEETTKETDNTSTQASEDSGETPAKQKQSNNIFSKLKQSLVKAKKAMTGKSPNSKTVTSDINAQ